ncbi:hypothetical protein HOD30_01305 [Candidatus Peregrinibacteria bacterium]|jgi:hypothetical protein|nr:hypothetical protein [Candidatus Peregrinibacteria bacterium]MBT4632260.1 hypothetical protein [Candidatus Peregrinibacteria bacterium]MBT5516656.1 hypothetical protein [Candidatus Peregrinibacteria bacterium]MBT5824329.1 hypothetical protein [Candidatus Peregrinibacteria bacterium]
MALARPTEPNVADEDICKAEWTPSNSRHLVAIFFNALQKVADHNALQEAKDIIQGANLDKHVLFLIAEHSEDIAPRGTETLRQLLKYIAKNERASGQSNKLYLAYKDLCTILNPDSQKAIEIMQSLDYLASHSPEHAFNHILDMARNGWTNKDSYQMLFIFLTNIPQTKTH